MAPKVDRATLLRLLVATLTTGSLLFYVTARFLADVDVYAAQDDCSKVPDVPSIPSAVALEETSRMLITGGLQEHEPDWTALLPPNMDVTYYPVLNASSGYVNKGHEAMFYLRYIVDHYDTLPAHMIFVHDHHRAWHNSDTTDRSIVHLLSDLRWSFVEEQGFVNLRCQTKPNCPSILPLHSFIRAGKMESFFQEAWKILFQDDFGPLEQIAATCCAQFAVTREAVQLRPRAFYANIINWLEQSSGTDWQLGRVLEYTWHIIFGREFVNCPDADICRLNLYGYKRELF